MILLGRLADIHGRIKVFRAGFVAMTAGSLIGAAATGSPPR